MRTCLKHCRASFFLESDPHVRHVVFSPLVLRPPPSPPHFPRVRKSPRVQSTYFFFLFYVLFRSGQRAVPRMFPGNGNSAQQGFFPVFFLPSFVPTLLSSFHHVELRGFWDDMNWLVTAHFFFLSSPIPCFIFIISSESSLVVEVQDGGAPFFVVTTMFYFVMVRSSCAGPLLFCLQCNNGIQFFQSCLSFFFLSLRKITVSKEFTMNFFLHSSSPFFLGSMVKFPCNLF